MPPVTVKLVDDQSPPNLVADITGIRLRVALCNGRGLPEGRTANGAQDLLVGEREVAVESGYATFQNLRVRAWRAAWSRSRLCALRARALPSRRPRSRAWQPP